MAKKKGAISGDMLNVLGERGEKIVYLALTEYSTFKKPLFRPAFLGDKWPTFDYYAELLGAPGRTPIAVFQVKTSSSGVNSARKSIGVRLTASDVERLNRLPVPVYLLGVCERTQSVFVRAVEKSRATGISVIKSSNKLTPKNLRLLHDEIAKWWTANPKPKSKFL